MFCKGLVTIFITSLLCLSIEPIYAVQRNESITTVHSDQLYVGTSQMVYVGWTIHLGKLMIPARCNMLATITYPSFPLQPASGSNYVILNYTPDNFTALIAQAGLTVADVECVEFDFSLEGTGVIKADIFSLVKDQNNNIMATASILDIVDRS